MLHPYQVIIVFIDPGLSVFYGPSETGDDARACYTEACLRARRCGHKQIFLTRHGITVAVSEAEIP